jgi:hypothetical protein
VRQFDASQPEDTGIANVPETMQALELLLEAIARSDGTRRSVLEALRRTRVENGVLGSFASTRAGTGPRE